MNKSFQQTLFRDVNGCDFDAIREDSTCIIDKYANGNIHLTPLKRITKKHVSLCEEYGVTNLQLTEWHTRSGQSLDPIANFASVKTLKGLSLSSEVDSGWNVVESLPNIESLILKYESWDKGNPKLNINFLKLPNLKWFRMWRQPAWDTIYEHQGVETLDVTNLLRVHQVDVSKMKNLRQLSLGAAIALREIRFCMPPKLVALDLNNCPKLKIDWDLLADSLQYLKMIGRNAFSLDEIGVVKRMKRASIHAPKGTPKPKWLDELPEGEPHDWTAGIFCR